VVKGDVRRFTTRLAKRAPALAARTLALLRAAFRWGLDEETLTTMPDGRRVARPRIDRDPTRRIEDELPKVKAAVHRPRERHLSDAEIPMFWHGLDALKLAPATFARIILLCGTRRGETCLARWRDLQLDGAAPTWSIPAEHRKGRAEGSRGARRGLVVPLAPLAVELLTELRKVTSYAPSAPPRWREWVFRAHGSRSAPSGTM
jgi:integrase